MRPVVLSKPWSVCENSQKERHFIIRKAAGFLLAITFISGLRASDLVSQHTVEYVVRPASRLEWTLHTRLRNRDNSTDLYQVRFGSSVDFDAHPRATLTAGYIFTDEREENPYWQTAHRLYGSAATPLHQGATGVELRGMFERFVSPGPDHSRLRGRLRFEFRKPLQPFLHSEAFVNRRGLQTTRYTGGIEVPVAHLAVLELGYTYDLRKQSEGGTRHFLFTRFQLRHPHSEQPAD